MASISRFITISVDDGHPTDFRTAELLSKYGLKATFYVPAKNPERPVLDVQGLQQLARSFELGGHTMGHVVLNSVPRKQAWAEISDCKRWLEDLTGNRIASFCYPRGKFDRGLAELVRKAGYTGARTCFFNLNGFPQDPYFWGVSSHAHPHSHTNQMKHALWERNFAGAWNYWRTHRGEREWAPHFRSALEHVSQHGGIAHLYMHSWEIDQMGQWNTLETIFQEITRKPELVAATNGELFDMWQLRSQKNQSMRPESLSQ